MNFIVDPKITDLEGLLSKEDHVEVDLNKRHKFGAQSFFGRLFHPLRARRLNRKFEEVVRGHFQNKYGFENRELFGKVWKHVLSEGKIEWKKNERLTVGQIREIDQAFQEVLEFHGEGVAGYADKATSRDSSIRNVVKFLFQGQGLPKEVMTLKNAKAVLAKFDPEMVQEFRSEMQHMLHYVMEHLPVDQKEEMLVQAFIGNILAILPFTYPQTGDVFSVPQLVDGEWKMIECDLERIELTPNRLASPITAIALVPKGVEGRSVLSFIGTTYPSGDGMLMTSIADFVPGMSVGKLPFILGKKKLSQWFERKSNVHVVGASLGGALTFHALNAFSEKIERVDAYNPAGIYPWEATRKFDEGPEIHVYEQANDFVHRLGVTPEGKNVHVHKVVAYEDGHSEFEFQAHAKAYSGADKVTFLNVNPKRDNQRWGKRILTAMHLSMSWIPFIPLAVSTSLKCLVKQVGAIHKREPRESRLDAV